MRFLPLPCCPLLVAIAQGAAQRHMALGYLPAMGLLVDVGAGRVMARS